MKNLRGAIVIAGKDLRNVFASPLFYVIAGTCMLFWLIFFGVGIYEFNQEMMYRMRQTQNASEGIPLHERVFLGHYSRVNFFLILTVGALTMRLFTEEKRNRTMDLLLTSPVSAAEIALGKLAAGTLTIWALVALSAIYPLSLAFFTSIEWGTMLSSYIGLLLLSACYVAIGMFASSVTSSAVVAVVMSLIFNVMLWFVGSALQSSSDPSQRAIYEHLFVGTHLEHFIKGTFSVAGCVFFVSVVVLFTFLTERVVESSRWR